MSSEHNDTLWNVEDGGDKTINHNLVLSQVNSRLAPNQQFNSYREYDRWMSKQLAPLELEKVAKEILDITTKRNPKIVGLAFKHCRVMKNLQRKDVAQLMGTTIAYIEQIEKGEIKRVALFKEILDKLSITENNFINIINILEGTYGSQYN